MRVYKSLTNEEAAQMGLSRITAWRSRKNGWYCDAGPTVRKRAAHIRQPSRRTINQKPITELTPEDWQNILDAAQTGVRKFMNSRGLQSYNLAPFSKDDLISESILRLVELSGNPNFQYGGWKVKVAFYTAMSFCTSEWRRHKIRRVELGSSDEM